MQKLKELVEVAKDGIFSYYNPQNPAVLGDISQGMLDAIKSGGSMNLDEMLKYAADNVVLVIFPHVELTDDGKEYFSVFDQAESLPSWREMRDNGHFLINPDEADFIRSLKDVDEKAARRILCATGIIRAGLQEELAEQKNLKEKYNE